MITWREWFVFAALGAIAIAVVLFFSGCATPYPHTAEEVDGDIVIKDIVEPDVGWTNWNLAMLGFAISGSAVDIYSTGRGLDRGCVESNPLAGGSSTGTLIGIKLLGLGTVYLTTEYLTSPENRQLYRNIGYGLFGSVGLAAGIHNYNVDCD